MRRRIDYEYVVALNYYLPHTSGLTDVARRVAEKLVEDGVKVCVICQRHDKALSKFETINGVDVVRASVIAKISNGLLSFTFPFLVRRYVKSAQLLHLHAPMLEAGLISLITRTKKIISYQCDFVAPKSFVGSWIEKILDLSSKIALKQSAVSIVSSKDYALNSRIRSALTNSIAISPPTQNRYSSDPSFRSATGFHYGFLGRIAPEKGLLNLVSAFQSMAKVDDRLLIAGSAVSVEGESIYKSLASSAERDSRIVLLGFVPEQKVADFYASIDAFVFPSVNALEAFGIAQAEAKALGIPLVTSDLPGVRTLIDAPKTGLLVRPGDVDSLAVGLERVRHMQRTSPIRLENAGLSAYIDLVNSLLNKKVKN